MLGKTKKSIIIPRFFWIVLSILLVNIILEGKDLLIEKKNGKVSLQFSKKGDIVTNVIINKENNSYSSGDLIFVRKNDTLTDSKLSISESSVNISKFLKEGYTEPFASTSLIYDNKTVTNEDQAALTIEGDLLLRGKAFMALKKPEPNYVRIHTYQEPGKKKQLTTTTYSDGMGRAIQTQFKMNNLESLVSGTYFDVSGTPEKNIKAVPLKTLDLYFPMDSNSLLTEANTYYNNLYPETQDFAYSSTKFEDDPRARVKANGAPGKKYSLEEDHHSTIWYYGIEKPDEFIPIDKLVSGEYKTIPNKVNSKYFLTLFKDPNGNFSQEINDISGNVIARRTYSKNENGKEITSKNIFDILGQLKTEIMPENPSYKNTYSYNLLGQLVSKTTPDRGTESYTYDVMGRIKTTTRPDNSIIGYDYDILGRLSSIYTNSDTLIAHYYDNTESFNNLDNFISEEKNISIKNKIKKELNNLKGRKVVDVSIGYNKNMTRDNSRSVIDIFSYDDEGRVEAKYKFVPAIGWSKFSHEYDIQGKILKSTVIPFYLSSKNSKPIIKEFHYDNLARLSEVTLKDKTNKIVSYEYTKIGLLDNKKYFHNNYNIQKVSYSYHIRNWLTKIDAGQKFKEKIKYDGLFNGSIDEIDYSNSGHNYNLKYNYDNINRLIGVTANDSSGNKYSEAFRYDKNGRIRNKEYKQNTIDPSKANDYKYINENTTNPTNKLKCIISKHGDIQNYEYDAHGNMTKDKSKKMSVDYDWRDMPSSFKFTTDDQNNTPLSHVDMVYDASGNRVLKKEQIEGGTSKGVAYIGPIVYTNDNIEEDTYKVKYTNITTPGGLEGRIDYESGTNYFYLKDHLGSTRSVIDNSGANIEATMYDSYGKIYPLVRNADNTREKFTGKEYDDDGKASAIKFVITLTNVQGVTDSTSGQFTIIFDDRNSITEDLNIIGTQLSLSKENFFSSNELINEIHLTVKNITPEISYKLDASVLSSHELTIGKQLTVNLTYNLDPGQQNYTPLPNIPELITTPNHYVINESGDDIFTGINLFYFGARYYDADVGYWVSTDPAWQYHSPYTYCGNNPIMAIDFTGTIGFGLQIGVSATSYVNHKPNLFRRITRQWEIRGVYDHSKGFGLKQIFNKHNWSFNATQTKNNPKGDIYFTLGEHVSVGLSFLFTNATHQSQLLGKSNATGLSVACGIESWGAEVTLMVDDFGMLVEPNVFELAIESPFLFTAYGWGAEAHAGQNYETTPLNQIE